MFLAGAIILALDLPIRAEVEQDFTLIRDAHAAVAIVIANENESASGLRIAVGHTQLAAVAGIEAGDWKWDTCRMVG